MSSLNNLVDAVSSFDNDFKTISANEAKLMGMRDSFIKSVNHIVNQESHLKSDNPLSKVTKEASSKVTSMIAGWAKDWDANQVSRDLSNQFGDKVILLVFGKVNAGKSSFSNFTASIFPEESRRYFYLNDGKVCDSEELFAEGVTETTARIQGVELGGKLILLDSPGLHSVTDKNGELTKRFTDSADAVLWLTPSTSPGQVQELDDLKVELESGKPLLPIITRSDFLDEDCDDDGVLFSKIFNKTQENRELQQADVHDRASSKLGSNKVIKHPISISVHSYKQSPKNETDLVQSGLSKVLICMSDLIQLASNYKPRKARQQIINYLDHSVLHGIRSDLIPMVMKLEETIEAQDKIINLRQNEVLLSLKEELAEKALDWAEELKESENSKVELAARINDTITKRLTDELSKLVDGFTTDISTVTVSFSDKDTGDFEGVYVDYEEVTGSAWKAAGSAGGAAAGAAAGLLLGPAGAIVGGILGGLLGGGAGSYFVETNTRSEKIGMNTAKVVSTTLSNLDQKLPKITQSMFQVWKEALNDARKNIDQIHKEIAMFEKSLKNSKENLANECS